MHSTQPCSRKRESTVLGIYNPLPQICTPINTSVKYDFWNYVGNIAFDHDAPLKIFNFLSARFISFSSDFILVDKSKNRIWGNGLM